ncbi:MAG: M24 family metallopeptidase [Acidilobaceae archaeon]
MRELKLGMTLTIEPGIYVKGLEGFRYSDTILVTEEGYEKITYYPKSLEDFIVEA